MRTYSTGDFSPRMATTVVEAPMSTPTHSLITSSLGSRRLISGGQRVLVGAADARVHAHHLALTDDGDLGHADVARPVPEPARRVGQDGAAHGVEVGDDAGEEVGDVVGAGDDAVVALHLDGRAVVVLRAVAVDARRGLDELEVGQRAGLLFQAELLVDLHRGDGVLHLRGDAGDGRGHLGAEVEVLGRRPADVRGELDLVERGLADDQRWECDEVVEDDRRDPRLVEDPRVPPHHQRGERAAFQRDDLLGLADLGSVNR